MGLRMSLRVREGMKTGNVLNLKEMDLHKSGMSAIPPKVEAKEMGLLRSVKLAFPLKVGVKEMGLLRLPKEKSLGTGRVRWDAIDVEIVVCSSSKLLMTPLLVILRVLFCSK